MSYGPRDEGASASPAMVSVPVAIGIGLIFSFVQSLGLTIQRKSHLIAARQPIEERRPEWRQPLWLFGFLVFLIANVGGTIFQIGALPIVMLAPLGAVSLLYNALLAKFLLQDVLGPMMIGGTALILVGAVLIGYFGAIQEAPHSLDELLSLFGRGPFVALVTMLFMTFTCVSLIAHLGEWQLHTSLLPPEERRARSSSKKKGHGKRSKLARRWSAPSLAPLDEVSETTSGVATPVLEVRDRERQWCFETPTPSNGGRVGPPNRGAAPIAKTQPGQRNYGTIPAAAKRQPRRASLPPSPIFARPDPESIAKMRLLLAVAFAALSGTLSGLCLLLAKSGVELLVLTFGEGKNQFNRFGSWALVGIMIFAAVAQLWYLNKALKMADPTLVCPLAFCFYNTSSIALGLVYFDQLAAISTPSLCLIILGIVVLLGGVFIVSMKPAADDGEVPYDEVAADEAADTSAEGPTMMQQSSPTETQAILANAGGVAGPHLPPPPVMVTSPTSDTDLESQIPRPRQRQRSASQEGVVLSPPMSPTRKQSGARRRGSHSRSSSITAGLGLHLPEYNLHHEHDEDVMLSPKSKSKASMQRSRTEPGLVPAPTTPPGSPSPSHNPVSPKHRPSRHNRGGSLSLYHSILNRGLSIGLGPSSPGFHIGPFSPDADGDEEQDEIDADSARALAQFQRQRGPRRVLSEADAGGIAAAAAARASQTAGRERTESREPDESDTAGSSAIAASLSSAYRIPLPSLDTAALTQRLSGIRATAWLGGVRRWWSRNVNGREDWGEEERRRLLGDRR